MNLRSRKTSIDKKDEIIERISRSPKKNVSLLLRKDRSQSPKRNKFPRNNKTIDIDKIQDQIEEDIVTIPITRNSSTEISNLDDINIDDDYNLKEIKNKILRAMLWNEKYIKYDTETHHEWLDRIIGYQKKLNKIRIRIPTYACYIMVCLGIGIIFTIHMLQLYGIQIEKSSLFTYRCHDDDFKPLMRGALHCICGFVSWIALLIKVIFWNKKDKDTDNILRHPSDFGLVFFGIQYTVSGIYHVHTSLPTLVSLFYLLDMGWIPILIIYLSGILRFRKKRNILWLFISFASICFFYECFCRGGIYEHYKLYTLNEYIPSLYYEHTVWSVIKATSLLCFILSLIISPAAWVKISPDHPHQRFFMFAVAFAYCTCFSFFGMQTVSRLYDLKIPIPWHIEHVWGYHEDFHFLLVVAHSLTSQYYDVLFERVDENGQWIRLK